MRKHISVVGKAHIPEHFNSRLITIATDHAPAITQPRERENYFLALAAIALSFKSSGQIPHLDKEANKAFAQIKKHANGDMRQFVVWATDKAQKILR